VKFEATPLAGAYLVELERMEDERGFFARSFCAGDFRKLGLQPAVAQCSVSFNKKRGTLRGMHYQAAPHEEAKLVRCTQGAIWDVIVDLRPGSASRGKWFGAELSAANHRALYIPAGLAHGFQTLQADCEVLYMMDVPYHADSARGVPWNDPAFGIEWPIADPVMSDRDRRFAPYKA
jgi:dTDP-4-dehydrorhamnose 3,5-epimerase